MEKDNNLVFSSGNHLTTSLTTPSFDFASLYPSTMTAYFGKNQRIDTIKKVLNKIKNV